MDTLFPFALLCFTSFFTLTNPLGTMPVFLTMTQGMSNQERRHIVKRATIISFLILMVFTFSGQFLFKFFGISTNGFRIAAGFIIFKIGYDMLQARFTNIKLKDEEIRTYANDISITPLSIPMLCGPGAIANGIMMMDAAKSWDLKAVLIAVIALVYVLTYFILKESTRLVAVIGETGNNVMMRLMGLILMLICTMMTSISIVREKETGTMEVLLVSPIRPIFIIIAKAVPYFLLSCVNLITILFLSVFVLHVPIAGSIFLLFAVSMLLIVVALSLGLLVSTLVHTQVAAMIISGMVMMMPVMLLSGIIFPLESMPTFLQCVSHFIPAKWYIQAIKKVMIEGSGFTAIVSEVSILSAMAVFLLSVSLFKFKYRLE